MISQYFFFTCAYAHVSVETILRLHKTHYVRICARKGLHDSGTNPTDIKFFRETKKTAATTIFFTGKVTGTGKYLVCTCTGTGGTYRVQLLVVRYLYFVHGPLLVVRVLCKHIKNRTYKKNNFSDESKLVLPV